jgi:hypothetical protein
LEERDLNVWIRNVTWRDVGRGNNMERREMAKKVKRRRMHQKVL